MGGVQTRGASMTLPPLLALPRCIAWLSTVACGAGRQLLLLLLRGGRQCEGAAGSSRRPPDCTAAPSTRNIVSMALKAPLCGADSAIMGRCTCTSFTKSH